FRRRSAATPTTSDASSFSSPAMGDLHLRLNQTQRVRLEAALHELQALAPAAAAVTFADNIPVNPEDTILKGHGTSDQDGEVVATVCGVVERVQNLVCVRTLRARYKPQKGDIIIGRVSEIASKRWRLETNFSQGAVLMLSSMNLPDGIQAEVCHIQHDGSLDLQPRSQKYGKVDKRPTLCQLLLLGSALPV
uniref:RRP4 S1 domain-containing protein n=1 Tax=Aegilops tauschii subsp. strangulata TaxID=200361 RepID=A0A453NFT6_AEGTS